MKQPPIDVAIIGAGPYGLSIAAHLSSYGIPYRIFGTPMGSWKDHMAAGTVLKSFGCASNLYDRGSTFTLSHFYQEQGVPYTEVSTLVPLELFTEYGLEFQRRFVPGLEKTDIISLERTPEGFILVTRTGEHVLARRVVMAVGITHFAYTPPMLAELPDDLATHSSQHTEVSKFAGQSVAVVGAGASAADLAGLLHEAGADVHMIIRRGTIGFNAPPSEPRPMLQRVLKPQSGLGHGWRGRLCTKYPLVFHALPEKFRFLAVQRVNGPAPHWHSKSKVDGHVTMHLGANLEEAKASGDGLQLTYSQRNNKKTTLHVDHVIAATGYKVALQRLKFIHRDLLGQVESAADTPILNNNFESSVPGLYMVGLSSANSFGPLCRFAYGAKFTSARLASHLATTVSS